jgi:hypothetical protein
VLGPLAGGRLVVEVEVVDVVEGDVGESHGAGSAVLEVDLCRGLAGGEQSFEADLCIAQFGEREPLSTTGG